MMSEPRRANTTGNTKRDRRQPEAIDLIVSSPAPTTNDPYACLAIMLAVAAVRTARNSATFRRTLALRQASIAISAAIQWTGVDWRELERRRELRPLPADHPLAQRRPWTADDLDRRQWKEVA